MPSSPRSLSTISRLLFLPIIGFASLTTLGSSLPGYHTVITTRLRVLRRSTHTYLPVYIPAIPICMYTCMYVYPYIPACHTYLWRLNLICERKQTKEKYMHTRFHPYSRSEVLVTAQFSGFKQSLFTFMKIIMDNQNHCMSIKQAKLIVIKCSQA